MASTSTSRRYGVNAGKAIKVPCICATTANITLSGEQTIDGIAVSADDRVLVKLQTDAVENGVYDVGTGAWQRSPDWNDINDVNEGTLIPVNRGTANAATVWRVTTTGTITPSTTSVAFELTGLTVNNIDASVVNYTPSGTGAVTTNLNAILSREISVMDFGAVGDGVTDDTAAFEAAITYANTLSDNNSGKSNIGVVIHVPDGEFNVPAGLTTKILRDNIWIVGTGSSAILFESGNLFYFGLNTAAVGTQVFGGGCQYMKFQCSAPAAASRVFTIAHATGQRFLNIAVQTVVQLCLFEDGTSPNYSNSNINFTNIYGTKWDGNGEPFFKCDFCNGVYLTDISVNNANASGVIPAPAGTSSGADYVAHTATVGDDFFNATTKGLDTLVVNNVVTNRFYRHWYFVPQTGYTVGNFYFENVIGDYGANKGFAIAGNGGNSTKIFLHNCWFVATEDNSLSFTGGSGLLEHVHLTNVIGWISGQHGFTFEGNWQNIHLTQCISSANARAGSGEGCNFGAGVNNFIVTSCTFGQEGSNYGFACQADNGLAINATADNYQITNCQCDGDTAGYSISAHAAANDGRVLSKNMRIDGTAPEYETAISSVTAPASGVEVENKTGMDLHVYIRNGTSSDIKLDSVTVSTATASTPIHLIVPPGHGFTTTYSSTPTFVYQYLD